MRFIVDATGVNPAAWAEAIDFGTKAGTRKVAERLRDEMRQAYDESIHSTDYGAYATNANSYSLRNFIVVNDREAMAGIFSVGAKTGQIVGNTYVDDIFKYMDEGTGKYNGGSEYWRFQLPGDRSSVTENGWWATSGQEGKEFISGTAARYLSSQFQADAQTLVMPYIDGALKIKL